MNSLSLTPPAEAPVTPISTVPAPPTSAATTSEAPATPPAAALAGAPQTQLRLFARSPASAKTACVRSGSRLGTRLRGQFGAVYEKRGHTVDYLTLTYSPKAQGDVAFSGKRAFYNFLHCESDPDIAQVQYQPQALLAELGVTSVALTKQRELQLRAIQSGGEAKPVHPQLEAYAEQFRLLARHKHLAYDQVQILACAERELIEGHEVRLRNWFRLLPWVAQARFHSLAPLQAAFAAILHERGQLRFPEAMQFARDHQQSPALFLAAAIRGVATGRWRANFDTVVFGTQSSFFVGAQA